MYKKSTINKIEKSIDINKENWNNFYTTNCYAYSLGVDLDLGFPIIELGKISGMNYFIKNDSLLKMALMLDIIKLNLNIEEVEPNIKINDENSWLIAMYATSFYFDSEKYDYHFLRKTKNINWSHKIGKTKLINNRDDNDKIINNPISANIILDENIPYNYIGSYLLTKKKK